MGPLLTYSDLDACSIDRLNTLLFERVRAIKDPGLEEIYAVYLAILAENGIMCSHPESLRGFGDDPRWFFCGMCKCSVIGLR